MSTLREQARAQRRSFSNQLILTLEAGLAASGGLPAREAAIIDGFRERLGAREVEGRA